MDIDITKLSESERKKVICRQENFEKETIKYNSILEQNYSKLNKTQIKAYDKAKDFMDKRNLSISIMRDESNEKLELFNKFNEKYHLF